MNMVFQIEFLEPVITSNLYIGYILEDLFHVNWIDIDGHADGFRQMRSQYI